MIVQYAMSAILAMSLKRAKSVELGMSVEFAKAARLSISLVLCPRNSTTSMLETKLYIQVI